jgi:hypothetical protein
VSASPLCKKTKSGGRGRHRRKGKLISDPEAHHELTVVLFFFRAICQGVLFI